MATNSAPQIQYRQEFVALAEQRTALRRQTVTTEAVYKGNQAYFLVAGSGHATAVTRGVNGLIPSNPDSLTQVPTTLVEWHDLRKATSFNIFESQGDRRRIMQEASIGVLNRKIDQDIFSALATATVSPWSAAGQKASLAMVLPYNLNLAYGAYDDSRDEDEYVDWLCEVANATRRVMKPNGSFFLNIAGSSSRPYVPFKLMVRLRALGFFLQNHMTWIKSIGMQTESREHFKPVGGRRFMHHNHEHIFHLTLINKVELDRLSIGIPFQDKTNIARRGHERDLRCRGDTWFIPYSTVKSKAQKFNHPGTFPIELPLWCIYLHGHAGVVLDPFVGTGTTLVAARLAGVQGIGIDIDPTYIETARQRVEQIGDGAVDVTLDRSEIQALLIQDPATEKDGGWQGLMVGLQKRTNKTTGHLTLLPPDLEQIRRYAFNYGNGGWESRLVTIFGRHLGPRLDRTE